MDEFSNTTNSIVFFVFMIILIIFVLAGFTSIFSKMVEGIRAMVQQLVNVLY